MRKKIPHRTGFSSAEARSLGLYASITRRDFLGATLIGSGAILLGAAAPTFAQGLTSPWNGYAGVGDYSRSNGNFASVVNAAHGIRDGIYEARIDDAPAVDELYDLIIVVGGFAGLIAAYEFRKARPNGRCLVFENHPVFGGEAKQNPIFVDGVLLTGPQGSNDAILPRADNSYAHVVGLWDEIGMPRSYDYIDPAGAARSLRFARDNYDPMYWNEETSSLGYAEFALQIRKQLQQMFGSAGFDARRDIAGIVINRWGHAYIAPQPGFYFGTPGNPAPLEVVRERYGRIAFGHSELSGRQSWGRAAQESRPALRQVLEAIA